MFFKSWQPQVRDITITEMQPRIRTANHFVEWSPSAPGIGGKGGFERVFRVGANCLSALVVLALSISGIGAVSACKICLGSKNAPVTFAYAVMKAETLVVASSRDGKVFRVSHVLKGVNIEPGTRFDVKEGRPGANMIYGRKTERGPWLKVAKYDPELRPFIQKLLPLRPIKVAPDRVWHERLDSILRTS